MIVPITPPLEIKTAREADRALASLVACEAEIKLIDATLAEAVGRATLLAEQEAAPAQANITILKKALEAFAASNRALIVNGRRKSLKLTCGSIGYRTKTDLVADDWAEVAEALIGADQPALLVCADPVADKKALAKLTDDELALWGVRRVAVETFYAAPMVAKVAEEVDA